MAKLICSFVNKNNIIGFIKNTDLTYGIQDGKVDVYLLEDTRDYLCVYEITQVQSQLPSRSMIIHKKSQTETLYTINAINMIIKDMNNGVLDKSIQIPWENYQNCLLITNGKSIVKKSIEYKETLN